MKRTLVVVLIALMLALCGTANCEEMTLIDGVEIATPELYRQTGTLPVYRAEKPLSFFDFVDLTWINPTKVVSSKNISKRGRMDEIYFEDEAGLLMEGDYLCYSENKGTMELVDDTGSVRVTVPRPSFSSAVARLAIGTKDNWQLGKDVPQLKRQALSGITLNEAKDMLEALLTKLKVKGFECVYALDMSVERIREMGAEETRQMAEVPPSSNRYDWDYTLASEADEGYYLEYNMMLSGAEFVPNSGFSLRAFVTASGIRSLSLLYPYSIGEVYSTPESLINPEDILARVPKDAVSVWYASEFVRTDRLMLMYTPMRAKNKKDGMVFAPVWEASYTIRESDGQLLQVGWAQYSALDGKLLGDLYH